MAEQATVMCSDGPASYLFWSEPVVSRCPFILFRLVPSCRFTLPTSPERRRWRRCQPHDLRGWSIPNRWQHTRAAVFVQHDHNACSNNSLGTHTHLSVCFRARDMSDIMLVFFFSFFPRGKTRRVCWTGTKETERDVCCV